MSTDNRLRGKTAASELPAGNVEPNLEYISDLILELQRLAAQGGYRSLAASLALSYAEADRLRDKAQLEL